MSTVNKRGVLNSSGSHSQIKYADRETTMYELRLIEANIEKLGSDWPGQRYFATYHLLEVSKKKPALLPRFVSLVLKRNNERLNVGLEVVLALQNKGSLTYLKSALKKLEESEAQRVKRIIDKIELRSKDPVSEILYERKLGERFMPLLHNKKDINKDEEARKLIADLKASDENFRIRAALRLVELGHIEGIEGALHTLFCFHSPFIFHRAYNVLFNQPLASLAHVLACMLDGYLWRETTFRMLNHNLKILGVSGMAVFLVPFLLNLLNVGSPTIRALAARNLGVAGDERAKKALIHLLNDENDNIRQMACASIAAIDQEPQKKFSQLYRKWPPVRTKRGVI